MRLPELYLDRVKYPTRLWLRNGSAHRLSGSEPSRWQHYSVNSEFSTVLAVFGLVLTGKPATHAGWVDTGMGTSQAELPMDYPRQSLVLALQHRPLGLSYKDAAHRLYMAELERVKRDKMMFSAFSDLEKSTKKNTGNGFDFFG